MTATRTGLTADERREARAALMRRRQEVAGMLEHLLAGQDLDLSQVKLPQEENPREPPVARLRRLMRLLERATERLDGGEAERCVKCGGPVSAAELLETPWADTCRRCA